MAALDRFTPLRPLGPHTLLVQTAEGSPLVLKRLPEELASDPLARHDFALEAWRVAQLERPLVGAVEDGSAGETPFYTMAYAEGPPATLVPPAEAAAFARQVAEGLLALHDHGWVHAALEPVNVRRTEFGAVLVGYGNLTPHGQRARRPGSGAFRSPEQAAGGPLDGRSDLYSLGALIHFWLTGEAGRELDLLDMMADPLAELGRWLLSPRPADRPADARALLAAMDRVLPATRRGGIEAATPRAAWLTPGLPGSRPLVAFEALLGGLDAGEGSWRRLVGTPGSGRTTWLGRAAARTRAAGWPVFEAAGEGAWGSPLAPWRKLWTGWEKLADERQPGLAERVRYRLGALAEVPGEPPAGLGLPWLGDLVRERALGALVELLTALAPPGMVVLLDDWDLADEASRRVLEELAARLVDVPIAWVVVTEAAPAWLVPLPLPGLPPDEARALVGALLQAPPVPADAEALAALAQGQPWFIEALVHAWVEQGDVRPGAGTLPPAHTWPQQVAALARLAASVVPEVSSWTVGAYAELLSPLIRPEALERAAEEPIAPGLDALLCANVLVRQGEVYRFAHPAMAAIYERVLPPPARMAAHRRLVEGAGRVAPGDRLQLAHHAIQAEAPDLIAPLALDAARVALAHGATDTARALLEEGLVTLAADHPRRGSYMALLGEIARRAGQLDDAVQLFGAAREALPGGPERQGVALALAHALTDLDDPARAVDAWREAAGHAQSAGNTDALAVAFAGLAEAQARLGQAEDAVVTGEAALGVAADAGPLPRARAMAALGAQLAGAGRERQAEGIALMQRAAGLLEAEGDQPRLLAIQQRLAEAEFARGELLFARDTAARAKELAGAARLDRLRAELLHAQACWALGETATTLSAATGLRAEALAALKELGPAGIKRAPGRALAYATLAAEGRGLEGLALAGEEPEASAKTLEALAQLPPKALPAARARVWLWHAEVLLSERQFPEAANALYEAQGLIKQAHAADLAGQRGYLLGVWAAATGDRERARQELRATLAQPNQWLVARAALLLGQLAIDAGARTEAAGWLEQARRGALALGAERLAIRAEHLERGLAPEPDGGAASPAAAARRLEALFDEARGLLGTAIAPAARLEALQAELAAAKALNVLWEELFDAMGPHEMASAMADAAFASTPARRVFVLSRELTPWAARARNGELPYEPGMVHGVLCRRAMESGEPEVEVGEAVAVPLVTPRHVVGVLYAVGLDEGPGLGAIAAAGALALERLIVPAPVPADE